MCILKEPLHLSVRTRGVTLEEAISLILRSHTDDHEIIVDKTMISITTRTTNERTQMQLPEHICSRIGALITTIPKHARHTRIRASEANFPEAAEAFARAWGGTRIADIKNARMLSVRRLALIIGCIERERISFAEAYKKAQNPNYHEVMRDID